MQPIEVAIGLDLELKAYKSMSIWSLDFIVSSQRLFDMYDEWKMQGFTI